MRVHPGIIAAGVTVGHMVKFVADGQGIFWREKKLHAETKLRSKIEARRARHGNIVFEVEKSYARRDKWLYPTLLSKVDFKAQRG